MHSFLQNKYLYSAVINLTTENCALLSWHSDLFPSFPASCTFDEFVEGTERFIHPMFATQIREHVTRDLLKKTRACNSILSLEVLIFYTSDQNYHWATLEFLPIESDLPDELYVLTVKCTDKERSERERNRESVFNKTVMDQLVHNYVLVHLVDLNSSMSRLVHSIPNDQYEVYAKGFDSHIELMYDVCTSFVQPVFQDEFSKFFNYNNIKKQLKKKESLILVFKDRKNVTFELTVTKYPEYSDDNALVIYAIKEII